MRGGGKNASGRRMRKLAKTPDHNQNTLSGGFEKMCKKLSYFLKQKISVIQAKSFCVQKNSKKSIFLILNISCAKLYFGSK